MKSISFNHLSKFLNHYYEFENGGKITQSKLLDFCKSLKKISEDGLKFSGEFFEWSKNEEYPSVRIKAVGIIKLINLLKPLELKDEEITLPFSNEDLLNAGILGTGICKHIPFKRYSDLIFPSLLFENENIFYDLKCKKTDLPKINKLMEPFVTKIIKLEKTIKIDQPGQLELF